MKNLILIIAALVLLNVTGFTQEYESLNFKIVNPDTLTALQSRLKLQNPNLEFTVTSIGYLDATDFDLDYILSSIQKRTMPTNNKKAYQSFENIYAYDINVSTKLEEVYVSYYTDYEIVGLPMLLVTILYGNDFTPNFEQE